MCFGDGWKSEFLGSRISPPGDSPLSRSFSVLFETRLALASSSSSNGDMSHFGPLTQRIILLLRRLFWKRSLDVTSCLYGVWFDGGR